MAGYVQGGRSGCLRSEIWLPLALLLAGAATGGVAGRGSWDPQGEEHMRSKDVREREKKLNAHRCRCTFLVK